MANCNFCISLFLTLCLSIFHSGACIEYHTLEGIWNFDRYKTRGALGAKIATNNLWTDAIIYHGDFQTCAWIPFANGLSTMNFFDLNGLNHGVDQPRCLGRLKCLTLGFWKPQSGQVHSTGFDAHVPEFLTVEIWKPLNVAKRIFCSFENPFNRAVKKKK